MQEHSSKTAHQRYRDGALCQVGTCMIGLLTSGLLHKSLTITFSAARCFTLQEWWWRVDDSTSKVAHTSRRRSGDQFVTVYKQMGNRAAKGHFKGMVQEPYAELTPAR